MRMLAVPGPGAFDDLAHRVAGLPIEFAFGGGGVGDEGWRIAFAAGDFADWDRVAGDFAAQVDDFLHARAVAGAEVEF